MGKKGGKKKEDKVYEEVDEQAVEEAAAASGALKPVKKAKTKKVMKSAAAKEAEAAAAAAAEVEQAEEHEVDVAEEDVPRIGRAVWVGVPEGIETFTMDHARRVMRAVGEVENVSVVKPFTFQVAFATAAPLRQALMLHNKPFSQLPHLSDKKAVGKDGKVPETPEKAPSAAPSASSTLPSPFTDTTHRITVELPLPAENRVYFGGVPNNCSNSEVARALAHFGKVAYVFRNKFKSYGFAAFKAPASVKRAVEEEVVIIRGSKISVKRYQEASADGARRWQTAQTNEALQYLRQLVPFNPYVLSSPGAAPAQAPPQTPAPQAASPFSLTPMAPPKLALEKRKHAEAAPEPEAAAEEPQKKKAKKAKVEAPEAAPAEAPAKAKKAKKKQK